MKRILALSVIGIAILVIAGCSTVTPMGATSNEIGPKVGEASAAYLFGYLPLGLEQDYGIAAAAANGGISEISTYDVKVYTIGSFYVEYTTIVTGR